MCLGLICPVLSDLEDGLSPVWGVISIIEQKEPSFSRDEVIDKTYQLLMEMLEKKYIQAYQYWINGDDKLLPDFVLTKQFIYEHQYDWKDESLQSDIGFFLTDAGRAYMYNVCKQEDY